MRLALELPDAEFVGLHLQHGEILVHIIQLPPQDRFVGLLFVFQPFNFTEPSVDDGLGGAAVVDKMLDAFLVGFQIPAISVIKFVGHLIPLLLVVYHIHAVADNGAAGLIVLPQRRDVVL